MNDTTYTADFGLSWDNSWNWWVRGASGDRRFTVAEGNHKNEATARQLANAVLHTLQPCEPTVGDRSAALELLETLNGYRASLETFCGLEASTSPELDEDVGVIALLIAQADQ